MLELSEPIQVLLQASLCLVLGEIVKNDRSSLKGGRLNNFIDMIFFCLLGVPRKLGRGQDVAQVLFGKTVERLKSG